MSREPGEDVRRAMRGALEGRHPTDLANLLDDASLLHMPGLSGLAGDYHGRDAILGLFSRMAQLTAGTLRYGTSACEAEIEAGTGGGADRIMVLQCPVSAIRAARKLETEVKVVVTTEEGTLREIWVSHLDQRAFDEFWTQGPANGHPEVSVGASPLYHQASSSADGTDEVADASPVRGAQTSAVSSVTRSGQGGSGSRDSHERTTGRGENAMGWLHKVLHGGSEDETESAPPTLSPADLVPPPLPKLPSDDPAAAHKRGYASKVCPSCEAPLKPLPRETTLCDACEEPIVVASGEDGQWHLLREADFNAFEERQEQIRSEHYKADAEILLEAGFLVGDVQVDVVEEADYQDVLQRMAGGRSRSGGITPVVALLTREPGHPHQKNAVRVDVDGETVGYIEKWNAKSIQPLIRKMEKAGRPAWVRAWIVGGWEDDHGDESFRVRLDSLPEVK